MMDSKYLNLDIKHYVIYLYCLLKSSEMGLKQEKKSVSERLDNLLIQILESLEQYVSKKEEYIKCVRDVLFYSLNDIKGLFDLTVHGLNRNSDTVDRYDLEDTFAPLYKV